LKGKLTKLLEGVKSTPEDKRDYIGASSIGHPCWRKIWFDYHGYDRGELPIRTRRIFDVGKLLEEYILDQVNLVTPIKRIKKSFVHVNYPWFQGNVDAYLVRIEALLEIKTANHASFQQFVNQGLRKWNEQYFGQVQAYMGLSGIPQTYVLAFDKNTAQFHDEFVKFDPEYYEVLELKAKAIHDSESMPPRVSENPLWHLCKMCAFKEVCHS
jgi:hypothetical protein